MNTALVTGAGSGIGRAIAVALARQGRQVVLVGRREPRLRETAAAIQDDGGRATVLPCDLTDVDATAQLARAVRHDVARTLDVLVHAAGRHSLATMEDTPVDEFDAIVRTNLRAPFLLTKALLPALREARGNIVFVNSSAALNAGQLVGAYAASKAALKALADSLRQEVNADGVRVLSVYPGRVATPMQERISQAEGRTYLPERLIHPSAVAEAVVSAVLLDRSAELTDLHIRPLQKPVD